MWPSTIRLKSVNRAGCCGRNDMLRGARPSSPGLGPGDPVFQSAGDGSRGSGILGHPIKSGGDGQQWSGRSTKPHTGFSSSVTGEVITRNTRSTSPEFEIACSTPGGKKIKSCLRTTWFLPAISISPSPSST
jgi:hypothetical protein